MFITPRSALTPRCLRSGSFADRCLRHLAQTRFQYRDPFRGGAKARCDVLLLTTSLFHLVAQHRLHMLAAVRVLYVGGEVLKPVHARALLAANPGITPHQRLRPDREHRVFHLA